MEARTSLGSAMSSDRSGLALQVKAMAVNLGFGPVGITSAAPFDEAREVALQRLGLGLMDGLPWYTEERVHRMNHPELLLEEAKSIISVAMSYLTEEPQAAAAPAPAPEPVAPVAAPVAEPDTEAQDRIEALEAQVAEQKTALAEMNREMNRLRKNNAQLREVNQSLRSANESQLGDANLINKAMMTELEGLRAAQSASEAEARAIIDALAPMVSPAAELMASKEDI